MLLFLAFTSVLQLTICNSEKQTEFEFFFQVCLISLSCVNINDPFRMKRDGKTETFTKLEKTSYVLGLKKNSSDIFSVLSLTSNGITM